MIIPKLSFVIPAYNAEKYIVGTLSSIVSQIKVNSNIEIVVINDGSTDTTLELIKEFKFRNFNININIFSKTNEGLSCTRNFGIDKAQGEYLWFFDADDLLESNVLEKIIKIISLNNIDLLSLGVRDVFPDSTQISNIKNKPSDNIVNGLTYISKYNIEHSACVFVVKKNILVNNNIYFLNNVLSEDYDFVLRLYEHCDKITHLNEICYNYIVRQGSLSRRKNNEYYLFHHESMLCIITYITKHFENSKNKEFSKEVVKYIVNIKLIALVNLLKSTLPLRKKFEYFFKFKQTGMFDLNYTGEMFWTPKQKILLALMYVKFLYPVLLCNKL